MFNKDPRSHNTLRLHYNCLTMLLQFKYSLIEYFHTGVCDANSKMRMKDPSSGINMRMSNHIFPSRWVLPGAYISTRKWKGIYRTMCDTTLTHHAGHLYLVNTRQGQSHSMTQIFRSTTWKPSGLCTITQSWLMCSLNHTEQILN